MEKISLSEKARYSDQFAPQILRMAQQYKVPLICMNPGQEIPPHPSGTGVFFIVAGSAVMKVGGTDVTVKAGDMVFVEKGEERGIRAVEKLMAFAVHITG